MTLEDLLEEHDPRKRGNHCPSCGNEGREATGTGMKCTTPSEDCEVVIWYP